MPQGDDLFAVWTAGPHQAFAVGAQGAALQLHEGTWRATATGTDKRLDAVWGRTNDDAYAFGEAGTILHFDGARWTAEISPTREWLRRAWGDAEGNLYVVGDNGVVLRRAHNEDRFKTMVSALPGHLEAIWGLRPDLIYVGGVGGLQLFDGATWRLVAPQPAARVTAIWGAAQDDLWIASRASGPSSLSETSQIYRFDGTRWHERPEASELAAGNWDPITVMWGADAQHLWLAGDYNNAAFFDGASWSKPETWPSTWWPSGSPRGIHGTNSSNVWVVGHGGKMQHFDGARWQSYWTSSAPISAIWGHAANALFAVTRNGDVLRDNGNGWFKTYQTVYENSPQKTPYIPFQVPLSDVCGNGLDVYAVSAYGWVYALEDGLWRAIPDVADVPKWHNALYGIWCDGTDQAVAVGEHIWRFKVGLGWSRWTEADTALVDSDVLYGVWGSSINELVAVGRDGLILRFDGRSWTRESIPQASPAPEYRAVWGSGSDHVFVVGNVQGDEAPNCVIWHRRSGRWEKMTTPNSTVCFDVWGTSPDDVYIAAEESVLRFDGSTWKVFGTDLRGCCASGWTDDAYVYAVGEAAQIRRRARAR